MDIIKVENLTKIYINGKVETPALRGVSFTVKKGEFLAIMGASGSGKSTLLHILGLLDFQTSGKYYFDGRDTQQFSKVEIAKLRNKELGFVFQNFNLLPRVSVLENVKLPLTYADVEEGEQNKMAEEAIKAVGISHRINHDPSQLSGGEKQRVAIARALVNKPKLIFADEPTGNLDSKSGEVVMELLQKANELGHTVILVTHETYTAEYAEKVIRLHDGKIEEIFEVKNRKIVWKDHFKK